jgi:hypothetical protein
MFLYKKMMQHFPIVEDMCEEEFYSLCSKSINGILAQPVSSDPELRELEREMYFQLFDGAVNYLRNRREAKELEIISGQMKEEWNRLGESSLAIWEHIGGIMYGIADIAKSSVEISARINKTKETQGKILKTANECQGNLTQARYDLADTQDRLDKTKRGIKGLEKDIKKIGKEAEQLVIEAKAEVEAKQTVIDLMGGMRGQGKQ